MLLKSNSSFFLKPERSNCFPLQYPFLFYPVLTHHNIYLILTKILTQEQGNLLNAVCVQLIQIGLDVLALEKCTVLEELHNIIICCVLLWFVVHFKLAIYPTQPQGNPLPLPPPHQCVHLNLYVKKIHKYKSNSKLIMSFAWNQWFSM